MDVNQIEDQLAALNESQMRSGSAQEIIGELTLILAQIRKDQEALVNAGFPWQREQECDTLLRMLSLTNAERMVSVPEASVERKEFKERMAAAEEDGRKMRLVISHIIDVTNDPTVKAGYKQILLGSGQVNNIQDNLASVNMIRRFPGVAPQIRPGGIAYTPDELDRIERESLELLRALGSNSGSGRPRCSAVDRQNRLITLCLDALSLIKKYARAAFINNPDYYDRYYATKRKPSASSSFNETGDVVAS